MRAGMERTQAQGAGRDKEPGRRWAAGSGDVTQGSAARLLGQGTGGLAGVNRCAACSSWPRRRGSRSCGAPACAARPGRPARPGVTRLAAVSDGLGPEQAVSQNPSPTWLAGLSHHYASPTTTPGFPARLSVRAWSRGSPPGGGARAGLASEPRRTARIGSSGVLILCSPGRTGACP